MVNRCLEITYYLAKQKELRSLDDDCNGAHQLVAEACEIMGTALYRELQGSWQYGYPIHRMTAKTKHGLAEKAAKKYEEAFDLMLRSDSDDENSNATWGLQFMIGKCYGKMANTYHLERFSAENQSEKDHSIPNNRKYEEILAKAFLHYKDSLVKVKRAEEEGLIPEQQMGACSHGSIEVLYRIHATRLKVLIHAICQDKKNKNRFEAEALRLVSLNWFSESIVVDNEEQSLTLNDRERMWEVLVDIVFALAFCRQEKALFHRSVYRHAQAILWAPVVYNPNSESYPLLTATEGAVAQPNILSNIFQSGVCVNAAKLVVESLFDKKRPQLCAAWVDSRSHDQAFQQLNESEKKFDLVRLKYIAARVELLRICRDLESLQTFLSWANACLPDLPSLYFVTAAGSAASRHNHLRENLLKGRGFLRHVKRLCTMAIADVILSQLHHGRKGEATVGLPHAALMDLLRSAYSCFLKLNCSVEDFRSWLEETGEEDAIEMDALLCAFENAKGAISDGVILDELQKENETGEELNKKIALLRVVLIRCKAMFSTRKYKRRSGDVSASANSGVDMSPTRKRQKKGELLEK